MKYAVLICGGMADRPMPDYSNITPLSTADKENIDALAEVSETGLVRTAEFAEKPSSEKALFSLFGYDAEKCFKGSSVFSLYGLGIMPEKDDVVFRCSLVRLSDEEVFEEKIMLSADTENMLDYEFDCIFDELSDRLSNDVFRFVKGTNKDIFIIWKQGEEYAGEFTSPDGVVSDCIGEYLPKGDFARPLYEMMEKSTGILEDYSSNAVWIWESSKVPQTESFENKFGLRGAVVSETDFARGMGIFAGMKAVFGNSAEDILKELHENDIVFYYIDMQDYGLKGDFDGKAEKITAFDREIFKPVLDGLESSGEDFAVMMVSDIAVPAYLERAVSDPVPYMIYRGNSKKNSGFLSFDENAAADSDKYFDKPHELFERFISRHE